MAHLGINARELSAASEVGEETIRRACRGEGRRNDEHQFRIAEALQRAYSNAPQEPREAVDSLLALPIVAPRIWREDWARRGRAGTPEFHGSRLRIVRGLKHITIEKLAESSGYSAKQIRMIERGLVADSYRMPALLDALGVPISFIPGHPYARRESALADVEAWLDEQLL